MKSPIYIHVKVNLGLLDFPVSGRNWNMNDKYLNFNFRIFVHTVALDMDFLNKNQFGQHLIVDPAVAVGDWNEKEFITRDISTGVHYASWKFQDVHRE